MSDKTTAFYRGNTEVSVDFSAEGVTSDGAVVLLEKLERKHKLISRFSRHIPDKRDPSKVEHSIDKLLKQRVVTLMQGYEDCNDAGIPAKGSAAGRYPGRRYGFPAYTQP